MHTLAEIKKTEQFFKQFDPMKKKASIAKTGKSNAAHNMINKQKPEKEKKPTSTIAKKGKINPGSISGLTKPGTRGLNSSSQLIGAFRGHS